MGSIKKSPEKEMFCKFPSTVLALALLATLCSPAVRGQKQWKKREEGKIDYLISTNQVFSIFTSAPVISKVKIISIEFGKPDCGIVSDVKVTNTEPYYYVDTTGTCGTITISASIDGTPCTALVAQTQRNFEIQPTLGTTDCQII